MKKTKRELLVLAAATTVALLTSLNTECSTYVSNRENCTSDCKNLNRWPVLKARNIRYQVLTFDRKDSL